MDAYLTAHPAVRDQFYATRNRPLTGCTVLHTAESVMDIVGPDTGAEAVAEFIRTRTTPGSYHDLADSDSYLTVVPYESGAYHDGTGSNNWALSISFACRTSDWRAMTPEKRAAFLRNGAQAFAAQQAWRRAHGFPLTELRYITRAQSDAGESGFIEHGKRDPGRRSDPGVTPPNLFPYDEWLDACRAALADTNMSEEDDLMSAADDIRGDIASLRDYLARGAVARLKQQAQPVLLRLQGSDEVVVAAVGGVWVPMPTTNPLGFAGFLAACNLAYPVREVPAGVWAFLRMVCTTPTADPAETARLIAEAAEGVDVNEALAVVAASDPASA